MRKIGKTRITRFLCTLLAAVMIAAGVPLPEGMLGGAAVQTVSAATELKTGDPVVVRFMNVSGSGYYNSWQLSAKIGDTITLPLRKGCQWKLDEEFRFKGNASITLSAKEDWSDYIKDGVLVFQAERLYTVSFYNSNGKRSSTYDKLQKSAVKNGRVRLPSVPSVSGYVNLGWSAKKNADEAEYKAGAVIRVKRNMRLYAVRKKVATSYVIFSNNKGTSKSSAYRKLNEKVVRNSTFTLPELPARKGYTGVGWTTTKGGSTPIYEAGAKVKITKTTRFYAVYKKAVYYKVSFYMGNGRSDSTYRKLTASVQENTYIELPAIPDKDGTVGLGWSLKRNSSKGVREAGSKYKVTKDTKFYAVQQNAVTVTLCKNDGTVYRSLTIGKGNYLTLPTVANATGYTFMGWSRTPGKKTNPEYEAGGRIKLNANVKLYAVVFDRSTEPDLTEADMAQVDLWKLKYKQIIFVGDSRTARTEIALDKAFGGGSTVTWNAEFVCRTGGGLDWLKSDGSTQLMNIVNKNNIMQKPTAVIFNLGVNDLANLAGYVEYLNTLAPTLKEKNCKLFYMSVNPGNSKMMEITNHTVRDEAAIRAFNRSISSLLADNYTFIDTYSWLMDTGYGTDASGNGVDSGVDDGLHYTAKTYKRIYYYCLEFLLNQN